MYSDLLADYARYKRTPPSLLRVCRAAISNAGFRAMCLYRVGRWCYLRRLPVLPGLAQRVMHHLCHCWISVAAEIGPGFLIAHVGGIVIGGSTRIGAHCDIRQNVTFGGNFNKERDGRTQPDVRDGVSVGAGAVIIGPVTIGADAIIGANSVVTRDVPANTIVSGVPAQVVRVRWTEDEGRRL